MECSWHAIQEWGIVPKMACYPGCLRVWVIGMGAVGTELVGYLVNMSEVSEIVSLDKAREKAEAEIWDYAIALAITIS